MTEQEIITTFQHRRARVTVRGWPLVLLGFGAVFWVMHSATNPNVTGAVAMPVFIVGLIAFAAGCIVVSSTLRCPVCDRVPTRRGVILNPTHCPHCGVRLNAPRPS